MGQMAKWKETPTILSPVAVKVKPLEWAEFGRECLRAPSLVGRYEILWGFEAGFVYLDYSGQLSKKQSIEAAKAAAQADYEARIFAALDVHPSPEAIVRAALERAAKVADKKIFHFTGHWVGALLEVEFKRILDLASDPAEVAAIIKKAGEDRDEDHQTDC
jgi:hypothetical protein